MPDWHGWLYMLAELVVIVNSPLAVSAFTALPGGENAVQRHATAQRAALTVMAVLTALASSDQTLLRLFDISVPAFQMGGGILVTLL